MDKFKRYSEIQKQIDILEAEKEQIRQEISTSIADYGEKNEYVNCFWKTTKKWTYSQNVKQAEESLKSLKKTDEENNIASCVETRQLNIKVI